MRPSPSGLSRVQGVRASHVHKSICVGCLLITFCERLWLWKKVWGGGVEIIQGRTGLGPEKRVGKKKGADGWGLAVGFSRPSCAAFCCLRPLGLIQLRALLLFLLVFWDLPGEEDWGEFCTWFPALRHFSPHTPPCCLEALSRRCLASSTHLSSPLRCRLCHTMTPMSRAAVPRPPRIPRARARVPSSGPSTEPVGRRGELRAQPSQFLSCCPSPQSC